MSSLLPSLHESEPLTRPLFLHAYQGRMGNGGAATLEALAVKWNARPMAEVDTETLFDSSVLRPVRRATGTGFELAWPGLRLLRARPPRADRDVLLLVGNEPHFRWRPLANELAEDLERLGCMEAIHIVIFNGMAAHTRPSPVHLLDANGRFASRLGMDSKASDYEGPVGFGSVLASALETKGADTAMMVGLNPFYLGSDPAPHSIIKMIDTLDRAIGTSTDTSDLERQRAVLDARALDALARSDEFRTLVLNLERQHDSQQPAAPWSGSFGQVDGPRLAADADAFLRGQQPVEEPRQ